MRALRRRARLGGRRAAVGAVAIAVSLAACAGADTGGDTTAEARAPDEAPPDAPAGDHGAERLRVAVPVDVGPLNIFAQHEEWLTELVYDKLLAPSPYVDEPQPWLAAAVERVDPSTWEVTVRSDVSWHDGEPFTADDVVFTVEYFAFAPSARWTHHVDDVPEIAVAEALDDHTVRFECAYPCPDLGPVTLADLPIIPRHVWEDVTEPRDHSDLPVGTGPYRLVGYDAADGYRFEANADYFAGEPRVDELVMPVIEDPSTTFTALRTGELDAAARPVPPELLDTFAADHGIAVAATAPLEFPELRLNYERPPFDDPDLRRAVSLAMIREELVDVVLLGHGRPATSGYPHPDSPWTAPDLSTPSDAAAARALLDELGYVDADGDGVRETPDGDPLVFELKVAGSEPTHVRAAELLVEDLADVGMDVTVRQLDAGSVADLFTSRDYDAHITTIGAHGVADPTQFIMSHRSGYLWTSPELPYPEWEALEQRWRAADTVEDRAAISFEMQRLFNERPTVIPLFYPDLAWAYRPDAYDGWVESRGYGIVHKWSLLPREVAREAHAIVEE